jgi:hypothetical protein
MISRKKIFEISANHIYNIIVSSGHVEYKNVFSVFLHLFKQRQHRINPKDEKHVLSRRKKNNGKLQMRYSFCFCKNNHYLLVLIITKITHN